MRTDLRHLTEKIRFLVKVLQMPVLYCVAVPMETRCHVFTLCLDLYFNPVSALVLTLVHFP